MSNFLSFDYPYSSTLNPRLYKIIKENLIDTGNMIRKKYGSSELAKRVIRKIKMTLQFLNFIK